MEQFAPVSAHTKIFLLRIVIDTFGLEAVEVLQLCSRMYCASTLSRLATEKFAHFLFIRSDLPPP